jgi:hypothetical protein
VIVSFAKLSTFISPGSLLSSFRSNVVVVVDKAPFLFSLSSSSFFFFFISFFSFSTSFPVAVILALVLADDDDDDDDVLFTARALLGARLHTYENLDDDDDDRSQLLVILSC